ncbi:hypothetical protein [Bradyrhizobium sp. RT5a]|uniref:hypothetical protein n=1 Tax=unclassified Bradyrhizobium TaxID=2631580 RepID=UPI003399F578
MKNTLIAMMAIAILVLGALVGHFLEDAQTSTIEIDRDRAAVAGEITSARELASKYSGGLIVGLINLRISVLEMTDTMLGLKRTALLRRITLTYHAPFDAARPASDAELDDILKELDQAQSRAAESRKGAERYSGGLGAFEGRDGRYRGVRASPEILLSQTWLSDLADTSCRQTECIARTARQDRE